MRRLWEERGAARELDVVGVGQSSIDHVGLVDGLPAFAAKEPLHGYERHPGGQIATAVLAASRLGLRTAFLGTVGDDEASLEVLAPLRAAGVDLAFATIFTAPGESDPGGYASSSDLDGAEAAGVAQLDVYADLESEGEISIVRTQGDLAHPGAGADRYNSGPRLLRTISRENNKRCGGRPPTTTTEEVDP